MSLRKKVTAILSVFAFITLSFSGCSNQAVENNSILTPTVSQPDSDWTEQQEDIILENDTICFTLDAATTHFTVSDKRTGQVYSSISPEGIIFSAEEFSARSRSELTLHYYEEQSEVSYMYSAVDSVDAGNFSVRTNGAAVRIYYRFGAMDEVIPIVLDEKNFNLICDSIQNSTIRRRIERYYIRYSEQDKPDDYADKLSEYPLISEQPLYIIDDNLTNVEKSDVSTYLSDAGYTNEQYQAMLKTLGLDLSDREEDIAGFVVPVEYTLNDDGFTASILADLIEEKSSKYKLQKIDFLEYFSATQETNGYYFIPDGSGALVTFGDGKETVSLPYYGSDYTENSEMIDKIGKNLPLPVFGASMSNGGVLAIIEQAEEVAQLNVTTANAADPLNHIHASFEMRNIDVTDYGATMLIPIYNLFSAERISVSPKIRFVLLSKEKNGYSDMAAVYRAYLTEQEILTDDNAGTPIYLDYLCMITENKSFLGIPYVKETVLSTLSEITKSVSALQKAGLDNIVVRLYGYGPSGYEHGAYSKYQLSGKVGSQQELEQLKQLLQSAGGQLYLDADMQFAFRRGNSFSPSNDAARYLNRIVAYRGQYDIVTGKFSDSLRKYLISPMRYPEYTSTFLNSLKEEFNNAEYLGLSYGSTGLYLGGDYAKTRDIDRTESVQYVEAALAAAKKDGFQMAFDNGNAYVLPYASHLFQLPVTHSFLDNEAKAVPFYEMVIHGAIPYAGTPYNTAADSTQAVLSSAAFGAAPYAAFITESDSLIANTQYESIWYSLQEDDRLNTFISTAQQIQALGKATSGASFVDFSYAAPDVTCSTYSNGVKVYVNFGNKAAVVDGVTIEPQDFVLGEN